MIKKSINPFMVVYAIAVIIGLSVVNLFYRNRLIKQFQEQKKRIEFLENEFNEVEGKIYSEVSDRFYEELNVEDLMKIVSEKRGFECSAIDTEVLKKLLNGETPGENDLFM